MALETDSSSQSENQLYLSMDVAVDEDWVWSVNQFELENNRKYVASACLVPTNCYTFFFFDEMGDGLTTGAMTLMLNEEVVLQIRPGDTGLEFQENSAASFWYKEFGTCTSVSTSSLTNNGT